MGKQSARIYFQGKDHKEIYYQGHYHKAMYIGSQLVWEKIIDERKELINIGNIVYRNGLFVVYSYSSPRGIFTGEDLENMHFIDDPIENSNRGGYAKYGKLMEEGYALIQSSNSSGDHWDTYLILNNDLSTESHRYKNTPFPITISLRSALNNDVRNYFLGLTEGILIKEKLFIPNSAYLESWLLTNKPYAPAGFNGKTYSDDVKDYIKDVFLKDNIAWGASDVVHGGNELEYVYQNFYSIDEKRNINKTEVRFPEEITRAIRLKVSQIAEKVKGNFITVGSISETKFYGDERLYYSYVSYDPTKDFRLGIIDQETDSYTKTYGYEYVINNKMYRYARASVIFEFTVTTSEGAQLTYERSAAFIFYWKIDLKTLEITDYEILDVETGYNDSPLWGIPSKGTIVFKYDIPDFTIYGINDGTIIYNLTSEGDTVHKISVKDFEKDEYGIIDEKFVNAGYLEEAMQILCTSAYLKDGYIYLYSDKYKNDSGHVQLRINVETNTGDTVDVPKVYYTEEE